MERPRVPCVGAVVRDGTGRLLLIRRGTEPARGLWSVPGGRVEAGESSRDATAREVHEETGLRVVVGSLAGVVERPGPGAVTYVIEDFLATPEPGTEGLPLTAGDDADDAAWFTVDELQDLDRHGALVDGLLDALRSWAVIP